MKSLLVLLFLCGSAQAQIVGGWYDQFSQPYQDPHILAWGSTQVGEYVTFTTPDRGQRAWLAAALDRAPAYIIPELGPSAILNIANIVWVEEMHPLGTGAELYIRIHLPVDPALVGAQFRFQVVAPMNGVWRTSLPWEIEVVP